MASFYDIALSLTDVYSIVLKRRPEWTHCETEQCPSTVLTAFQALTQWIVVQLLKYCIYIESNNCEINAELVLLLQSLNFNIESNRGNQPITRDKLLIP